MFKFKKLIVIFILIILFTLFSCIVKKTSKTSTTVLKLPPNPKFISAPTIPTDVANCLPNETFSLLRIYNNLSIPLYISAERYDNDDSNNNFLIVDENSNNYSGAYSGSFTLIPGASTYIKVKHIFPKDMKNIKKHGIYPGICRIGCVKFNISDSKTLDSNNWLSNNILDSRNYPLYVASMARIILRSPGVYSQEFANGVGPFSIIPDQNTYFTDMGPNTTFPPNLCYDKKIYVSITGKYKHSYSGSDTSYNYLQNTSSDISINFSKFNEDLEKNKKEMIKQENSPLAKYSYYEIIENGTDASIFIKLSQDDGTGTYGVVEGDPIVFRWSGFPIKTGKNFDFKRIDTSIRELKSHFEMAVGVGLNSYDDSSSTSHSRAWITFEISNDSNMKNPFAKGIIKIDVIPTWPKIRMNAGAYLNSANGGPPECGQGFYLQFPAGRTEVGSKHGTSTKQHWYKKMIVYK